MVRKALLIAGALLAGVAPVGAAVARGATLIWPESRQPVPNGGDVQLWEDFHLDPGPMAIPCQATPPSTVVVNAQSVDEVRQQGAPAWSECGSVAVTGGWVAIGFDEHVMKAVAVPAVALTQADGCSYELAEVEGRENELAGYASWTVSGSAALAGSPSPSTQGVCAPELPLTGTVELLGPQSGGFGVIPWGTSMAGVGGQEPPATAELNERMLTATRLARLGRLFPSVASRPFSAPGPGTLVITWYASTHRAHAAVVGAHQVLVARGSAVFSAKGTRRVVVRPTRRGRALFHRAHRVTLATRASFTPHRGGAIVVTGTSSCSPNC